MHWAALVHDHGYALAFVGSILEGETVLMLAGLAAHRGYLHWPTLVLVGALGSFVADQACFLAGRRYGSRLVARFPRLRPALVKVESMLLRYPRWAVIAIRFLYGVRTAGPVAIGMSTMRWNQFIAFNAIGAGAWSLCWVGAGYLAGNVAEALLGDLERIEKPLFITAASVAAVVVIVLRLRRRALVKPNEP